MVEARVDHSRVVDIMRRAGQLPLVKDYLLSVQKNNLSAVRPRGGRCAAWQGLRRHLPGLRTAAAPPCKAHDP